MKIRSFLLIVMVAALGIGSGVYAKPCTLTPEKAPTLFGFKLGMTQAAAEKLTGQKPDEGGLILFTDAGPIQVETGDKYIIIFNDKQQSKLLDKTVKSMSITFLDGKLFEMSLDLNFQSPWVKAPDKLAFFQKQFGIPADAWEKDPEGSVYYDFNKKVTCNGVASTVTAGESIMKFAIFETAARARVDQAKDAASKKYLDK